MKQNKVETAEDPFQSVGHDGAIAVNLLLLPSQFEIFQIKDGVKINVSTQCRRVLQDSDVIITRSACCIYEIF